MFYNMYMYALTARVQIKQDCSCIALSPTIRSLGEKNGLFNEESNETQQVSAVIVSVCWCAWRTLVFALQLIGDILSKVFDDENAPAFEAFTQVTIAIMTFCSVSQ